MLLSSNSESKPPLLSPNQIKEKLLTSTNSVERSCKSPKLKFEDEINSKSSHFVYQFSDRQRNRLVIKEKQTKNLVVQDGAQNDLEENYMQDDDPEG